jgi:PKD repeat protein
MACVLSVVAALLTIVPAATARADTAPLPPVTTPTVSADALPTVQINGVVWDQLIVGNTVYATGEFTSARPAGSPAGSNETPRSNILAYNLATGQLITSWAGSLNGMGRSLAASQDGKRIFVSGSFTQADGVNRYRLAALDAATGNLISAWAPAANARVSVLNVSGDTVYMGGIFTTISGLARTRLAAVSASTGAVLDWAPTADAEPLALTAPAGSGKVVAGGRFTLLNGTSNYGMGALDATTGAVLPWATTATVRDAGANSAIYSLRTDGNQVYGTGYTFGSGGNFEATFAAHVSDGSLEFVSGCLGDTYDSVPIGGVLYSVGHAHNCSAIEGLPQTNPWTYQRAQAESTTWSVSKALNESGTFIGQRAPDVLHWTPYLDVGTYTGQSQAAWTVEGNSQYVVLGGEFPRVNGVAQQGLVRFAVRSLAPNKQGPLRGTDLTPTVGAVGPGSLRVSWTAAYDRDNRHLTYQVLRGATLAASQVIATLSRDNAWWNRPGVSIVDTTAPAGSGQTYRIRVRDDLGNVVTGNPTTGTVPTGTSTSARYATAVRADGALDHWRLGESTGTTGYDWTGGSDLTVGLGVTRGTPGAISGDADTATTFSGFGSVPAVTKVAIPAPEDFTAEAWFKTTSSFGGKIIGFGNSNTGTSSTYDRHVYLTNSGQVVFGAYLDRNLQTVASSAGFNNGQWHHVAASIGSAGMQLYLDGQLVGSNVGFTTAQQYTGYWRIGGDNLAGWPNSPLSNTLAGSLDEVTVYPTQLSASTIANHYQLARGGGTAPAPAATFTTSSAGLTASFDASTSVDLGGTITRYAWDFGDGTKGSGVTASHTYPDKAADYNVTLTVTDDSGTNGMATQTITITPPANQPPTASFTTTTSGLTVNADGTGSSDPDGTVATYVWEFGDGATGTGATASHTYATSGTYQVKLTVTDNRGGTGSTTAPATVTDPHAGDVVAADAFGRSVTSGFGTADTGGPWTLSASGSTLSVTGGAAEMSVPVGRTATAALKQVSSVATDLIFTAWADQDLTGGGAYLSGIVRSTASGDYRVRLRVQPSGQVASVINKVVGGSETSLTSQIVVPGVTYSSGAKLSIRVQAAGSAPTQVRYRVWLQGTAEPTSWLQTVSDGTAGLQDPGAVGLVAYTSSTATQAAVLRFDDLSAVRL